MRDFTAQIQQQGFRFEFNLPLGVLLRVALLFSICVIAFGGVFTKQAKFHYKQSNVPLTFNICTTFALTHASSF